MSREKETIVAGHYGKDGLEARILDAIGLAGLDLDSLTPADLAPIDEFHMGGRAATAHIVGLMDLAPGSRVLDIGSGLGGVVRFLASEKECRATGIDLTPEYVGIARTLTEKTGLADRAGFRTGSALDLPFPDGGFDAATTFHVAMNIADRPRLYAEAARVLRPGGKFAIFDVMKGPAEGMTFPVPWAETEETSFLTTPAEMDALLRDAGFAVTHQEDRSDLAVAHHRTRLAEGAEKEPPILGLHLLQGESAGLKSRNMLQMLEAGQILLIGMIAQRTG